MAAIAIYSDKISTNHSITWSDHQRISLCTDTFTRCLKIHSDPVNGDSKVGLLQSSIPVEREILDIPQFPTSYQTLLINHLPREEFKVASTDRLLNPMRYAYDTLPHTGCCQAEWSCVISSGLQGRPILAVLSFDYRLCLYWQKDTQFEWFKLCDLTEISCKKTRKDIKTLEDYYPYKDWCFSQAVTCMKWFPESVIDSKTGHTFLVLAAGMKSGHVVLWKINLPISEGSEYEIICTTQPLNNQIVSMEWCSSLGLLAVGYLDGQVHGLHIDVKDWNQPQTSSCLYAESTLLKPSLMCFLHNEQAGSFILLVNAEHCVLAFHLSSDGQTVISQTHLLLENQFPSVGMCMVASDTVLMMSYEAILQKIVVTFEQEEIQLKSKRVPLDLPTDPPYVCHGFCLSPNKIFAAFVIRPWPSYDVNDARFKLTTTSLYVRCLDDLQDSTSTCRDTCLQCLMNTSEPLGDLTDILELYRLKVLSDDFDENIKEEPLDISNLRNNQLLRFKKIIQIGRMKNNLKTEELDENTVRFQKYIDQLTSYISAYWINAALRNLTAMKISYTEMSETDRSILHAMLTFMDHHADELASCKEVTDTRETMKQLVPNDVSHSGLKCCVCNDNLQFVKDCWQCNNGHFFNRCSLTCLPVEGVEYSICQVCRVNTCHLIAKDCTWLPADVRRCLFCENFIYT